MRWTGPILAVFIVYHILHMTTGTLHPHFVEGRVYQNLVTGLAPVAVALFYLVAMGALAFHLYHGAWSMLQTLGLSHPKYDPWRKRLAALFTILVAGVRPRPDRGPGGVAEMKTRRRFLRKKEFGEEDSWKERGAACERSARGWHSWN